MPRFNNYVDPRRDALDQARLQQGEQRLSINQEQSLLDRAKMVQEAAIARFKIETARRETIASAKAIAALGEVNPTSATYARDRARVMASFPEALGNATVREVLGKTDQMFLSNQGAQQNLVLEKQKADARKALEDQKAGEPTAVFKATNDTLETLGKLKSQFAGADGKGAVPQYVNDAIYNLGQVTKDMSYQAMQKSGAAVAPAKAAAAVPVAAAPTATPTAAPTATPTATATPVPSATPAPAQIAASDATSFLAKALGQTPAAPAATPQPVAPVTSGLPDSANSALDPEQD